MHIRSPFLWLWRILVLWGFFTFWLILLLCMVTGATNTQGLCDFLCYVFHFFKVLSINHQEWMSIWNTIVTVMNALRETFVIRREGSGQQMTYNVVMLGSTLYYIYYRWHKKYIDFFPLIVYWRLRKSCVERERGQTRCVETLGKCLLDRHQQNRKSLRFIFLCTDVSQGWCNECMPVFTHVQILSLCLHIHITLRLPCGVYDLDLPVEDLSGVECTGKWIIIHVFQLFIW